MTFLSYDREIEVARTAALQAGELALRYQSQGVTPEYKPDHSPVTVADRESEALISGILAEAFPGDGLLGEEGGARDAASGRRWIVDPIDGTRSFAAGLPSWGVLIALETATGVEAGVCHFPAHGVTYYAARGAGAWRNGSRIHVSDISDPAQAVLYAPPSSQMKRFAFASALAEWSRQFGAARRLTYCEEVLRVASGEAQVSIQAGGKAWDLAAPRIVSEEAGARFFNFDGGASIYAGNCVVAVPSLVGQVRKVLGL